VTDRFGIHVGDHPVSFPAGTVHDPTECPLTSGDAQRRGLSRERLSGRFLVGCGCQLPAAEGMARCLDLARSRCTAVRLSIPAVRLDGVFELVDFGLQAVGLRLQPAGHGPHRAGRGSSEPPDGPGQRPGQAADQAQNQWQAMKADLA